MYKTLLVIFLAACGGSSKPPPAPPPPTDPVPMTEPEQPTPVAEKPAEPPVEPSQPQPDPQAIKAQLVAAENEAFERARPVFQKHCARCHQKGGNLAKPKTLGHFDMTSYPFGGHHAMEISKEIRKALGIGGGKATMPKGKVGSVKGDELALIAAWADAFDKAHEGGAHEGMDHGDHGGQGGGNKHQP